MRLVLIFLLLSIFSNAYAFTYSETLAFDKPSAFELALLSQNLNHSGFHPLDQNGNGRIPFLNMDQVFERSGDEVIFLKLGMKASDPGLIGKILAHPKGFMYHALTPQKTPYAIFFYNMTRDEVDQIVHTSLARNFRSSKLNLISALLLLPARAESPNFCLQNLKAQRNIGNLAGQSAQLALGGILKSCAVSAFHGAVDGAKNFVQQPWYVIKNLFTNPEKLWDDVVAKYEKIKDLVLHLGEKLSDFFATLETMDANTMAEIACSTVSGVIIQNMLQGGIATAGVFVIEKIAALSKIKNSLMAISTAQKLNPESKLTKDLAREVVACAK